MMNTFQKFVRLTPSTQRRIIKASRQVERVTRGIISFDYVAESVTEMEHERQEQRRSTRDSIRRVI
jgi:hypothetical protein